MATYRGFSTIGKDFGNFVLEDKELAKRDLMNHFYTRKGERLGEPEFGSIIPDLIFEQLDDTTIDAIEEDIIDIIDADPRWTYVDVRISTSDNSITCEVEIIYVSTGTTDQLYLKYTTEEEI